jgi:integrase
LRWADLDLKAGVATIRRALTTIGGHPAFGEPKTAGSRRCIPLPGSLVTTLVEHRRQQAECAMRLGPAFDREADLVFANGRGCPLELRNLAQRHLKPILRRAKLPESLRLYDLRHTHATLLLAEGVHPKVAAERLGHATTRMTLDVYSHVLPGMQEEATRRLGEVVFGPSGA